MASRLVKTPLLQARRQLAAQTAAAIQQKEAGVTPAKVQASKLENGLAIVSCNNGSPLTTLGVLVKAGSRYETYDNLGACHALRNSVGLTTKSHTSFGVVRNVQQMGSQVAATVGREHIMFSSHVLTGKTEAVADYLLDVVANPAFKPWEVLGVAPGAPSAPVPAVPGGPKAPAPGIMHRMRIDLAEMDPTVRASELLHKAAYRDGLGNSIYSPDFMVGKHGPILLSSFHQKHFTTERACLVAVGAIEHNHLAKLADSLSLGKGAGPGAAAAKYYGGELRHDSGGKTAYIALAGDCTGTSIREMFAGHLLHKILGVGSRIIHCNGAGQLQKAVVGDGTAAVSSINFGYTDSSLIGAFIACDAANAGQVVSKVAAALRSVSVTDAEVQAAKKALCLELTENFQNPGERAEILAACAMYGYGDFMTEKARLDGIAQATVADVQAVATKLASAKLSMGAVGNLGTVPYVDAL